MSLRMFGVVLVIFMIALFGSWAENPPHFLLKAQGNVEGASLLPLQEFSGTYALAQGTHKDCPDGEFTVSRTQFHVGANYRIERVNQGRYFRKGSCHETLHAQVRGQSLIYRTIERCGQASQSSSLHRFDFSKSRKTRMIKLRVFKKTAVRDSHESSLNFQCLYRQPL